MGALTIVNLDFIMDPVAVAAGEWRWRKVGHYFGVPVSNFVGWFITGLITMACFSLAIQGWQDYHQIHRGLAENLLVYVLITLQAALRGAVYGIPKASLISLPLTLGLVLTLVIPR